MMQRLTMATLAGEAADFIARRFHEWRLEPAPDAVDYFAEALRANSTRLPIVYWAEWIDRWLMGDQVPGPNAVEGRRFQTSCMTPEKAGDWAGRCGNQWPEQRWLAARLREAADACGLLVDRRVIVVLREVLDVSTDDDEV